MEFQIEFDFFPDLELSEDELEDLVKRWNAYASSNNQPTANLEELPADKQFSLLNELFRVALTADMESLRFIAETTVINMDSLNALIEGSAIDPEILKAVVEALTRLPEYLDAVSKGLTTDPESLKIAMKDPAGSEHLMDIAKNMIAALLIYPFAKFVEEHHEAKQKPRPHFKPLTSEVEKWKKFKKIFQVKSKR